MEKCNNCQNPSACFPDDCKVMPIYKPTPASTVKEVMPLVKILGNYPSTYADGLLSGQVEQQSADRLVLQAREREWMSKERALLHALKDFQSTEADWLEKWSNGVTRTMQQDYDLLAHIAELREGK